MRLTGRVTVVNNVENFIGYAASSELGRPCKCVLEIWKRGDGNGIGRDVLSATITDICGRDHEYEYDVRNIAVLRTTFVNQGHATIEIKQPPLYLILRDCKPEQLVSFMDDLKMLHSGKKPIVTSAFKNSCAQNEVPQSENKETLESLRKGRPTKRSRSPESSKNEQNKIRKTLPLPPARSQTIRIKERAKYPTAPTKIHPTTERIYVQGIGLKIIDRRFLKLKWLHTLDLRGNLIENIDVLAKLSSFLQSLILDKNQIAEIRDDLFNAPAFQKLQHLDLSGNRLTRLPTSVLNLEMLASLYISGNKISHLPYNWIVTKNLRILNVAGNRLQFIPATLLYLRLTSFDMSGNPDLQRSDYNMDPDYVGFSCVPVPTLFEMACEEVMNGIRPSEYGSLPSVVQGYLQAGKYCVECGKKTLKYKVVKGSVLPSSFNRKSRPACEVSPSLLSCFVKKILCPACESKCGSRV